MLNSHGSPAVLFQCVVQPAGAAWAPITQALPVADPFADLPLARLRRSHVPRGVRRPRGPRPPAIDAVMNNLTGKVK